MTDKIHALPPRPHPVTRESEDGPILYHSYVKANKHMDAQDARIAELEARQTSLIDNATQHIAELEREVREARLMLLQAFQHRNDYPAWGTACKEWLSRTERNAERVSNDEASTDRMVGGVATKS